MRAGIWRDTHQQGGSQGSGLLIGEQHVREDCRRIPTVVDWLKALPITLLFFACAARREPHIPDVRNKLASGRRAPQTGLSYVAKYGGSHRRQLGTP